MLDAGDKIRIWLAGSLAVLVMGGVVALALTSRPTPEDGKGKEGATVGGPPAPYGRPGADRKIVMPPDCEPDPASPPKIVFDLPSDTLDLGKVKQGVVIERDVMLRNVGSGVLCVANVETGCGCVKAELIGSNRIPPHGTAAVRIKVDTKGKEGSIPKDVKLHVNDRSRKDGIAIFHVRCEVSLGIVAAYQVVDFRTLPKGKPGTAVLRLKSPLEDPEWHVTGVTGSRAKFAFEERPAEPADPVFRVVDLAITHPGTDVMGPGSDVLKITTTHPDRSEIVISAAWMVVTRFFAKPPQVPFGFIGGDAVPQPFGVVISGADRERRFKVTGARVEGQGFEAAAPEERPGGEWVIFVTPKPDRRGPGPVSATLVVAVEDEEFPEIRVPLRATVRPPK